MTGYAVADGREVEAPPPRKVPVPMSMQLIVYPGIPALQHGSIYLFGI